ncbi:MAG: FlgD immunoglobulin-like domain containing protein [bacterium]
MLRKSNLRVFFSLCIIILPCTLKSEFLIDTSTAFLPAPYDHKSSGVAYDGTNYMIVWEDWRSSSNSNIYCARVNESGQLLDLNGIIVSTAANNQKSPAIAFDGTNYLVVWEDYRNSPTIPDIYCTRVDQSGTVLNPSEIAISTSANHQITPKVAFGGTNYLVVWADNRNGNWDIYGARITTAGTVLDPNGIPICTNNSTQLYPSITFDGTNYIVVWADTRNGDFDIYGAQVTTSGTVVYTFVVSSRVGNQIDPAITVGLGDQINTVYSGFTDYINNIPVNTMRIWCNLYSLIGIEEDLEINKTNPKIILSQNLPNPFKNITKIKYSVVDKNAEVFLAVYDIQGRLVKILVKEVKAPGEYSISWDGKDENGNLLPAGLYFYKLENGVHAGIKKILLLK